MQNPTRARASASALGLWLVLATPCVPAHDKSGPAPAVVLAPGYSSLEYDAPKPGSYSLPPLGAAVDAQYIDSSGTRGRLHELFANHVTILSFIYTQCDDINGCPLATYVMSQVAKRLRNDPRIGEKLRMVSFSFDLERDTPQALAKYASSFRPAGAEWDFVVAPNRAALSETLAHYQQSVQQSGGHAFAHILRVFLVDSDARIRNIYSTSFLHGETLAADVETVLLEQGDIATPPADTRTPGYETATSVPPTAHHDPGLGLPPLPSAAGPPAGNAAVALGERLFFDRRLSLNRTISCAMCHVPAQGFTVNQLATAVGIEGRTVKRNAPTLLNVGFLDSFFHDARENRLEHQVWAPLLARNEMGNPSIGYVIEHLKQWPDYVDQFRAALDSDITMESVGAALAAYQRSLVAGASAFDRFFYAGETTALGPAAQRGFELFRGKANCASCHSIGTRSALFTDQALHNTGLGYLASMASGNSLRRAEVAPGTTIDYDLAYVAPSAERKPNDLGRYEVTEDPDDRWKFRTPSLRNVQLTAPYMHDGSLSSLADVIAFYNDGGVPNDLLDPLIRPLGLSANEQVDLLAFLRSLTSPVVASLIERAERTEVSNPAAGN